MDVIDRVLRRIPAGADCRENVFASISWFAITLSMKRILSRSGLLLALALLVGIPEVSRAGMDLPLDKAGSHWISSDQSGTEVWLISRADGTMEMHGRDLASTYSGIVLSGETPGSWICHGTGFRFVGGLSFTYRSSFRLESKDGASSLVEEWTATLPNGEVINGKTEMKEAKEAE